MGSWGIDTFENDTACDVLGDAIESLKKVVRRDIKNLQTKSGRTILERRTVPALAVIDAIASAIPSARHSLAADEVEEWKSIYVAQFDACLSGAYGNEVSRVRDDVVRLFDRVQGVACGER